MLEENVSELLEMKQCQCKTNEIDSNLIKVNAAFRGYKTRKFFYLFQENASVKDLDIFTNFPKFKSIFSFMISQQFLDYIEKSGMFFKSSDLADTCWTFKRLEWLCQIYYGELDKNGNPYKFGISISNDFVYEGSWDQGKFHGKGRLINNYSGVYNGEFNAGARHGNGEMILWKGAKYSGSWVCDKRNGFGIWHDGNRHYEGNFSNGWENGYGKEQHYEIFYKGYSVKGVHEGKGKLIEPRLMYKGNFKDGFFDGKGVLKTDSWTYSGDFVHGMMSGFGVLEIQHNRHESTWNNNYPVGEWVCHASQGVIKTGKWLGFTRICYIDEILPNLYLGTAEAAVNEDCLKQLGIKCIVRILDEEKVRLLSQFIYCYLKAKDDEAESIINRVHKALYFIKNCIEKNKKVLVHSIQGVSRGPTVVIAYMMKMQHMSFEEAFKFVQSKRQCVNPNKSFIEQLKSFII